jgi:hypothetical protein
MSGAGKSRASPRRRSAWLLPLAVFVVTAGLSAAVLAYFSLGPARGLFGERPAPTDSTAAVALTIGENSFHIPANYLLYSSARRGGDMNRLEMIALAPDLQPYSLDTAQEFSSNAPDSRVLNITLREDADAPSAAERLENEYLPMVEDRNGIGGPHGLTLYAFRADSDVADRDLLVGGTPAGQTVLLCEKETEERPAPSCEGETRIAADLVVQYGFRRAHLQQWRDIDAGIRALMGAFMDVR